VNLVPYFDGGLASSNRGGDSGVAVNFLDDGGAVPLMKNMPANGNTSKQFALVTHLYQFFGSLLGCSMQGMPDYSAYVGHPSMTNVHQFMDIDAFEFGYFVTQVGLSAASFGVADADVATVGQALAGAFGMKCAPPTTVIPAQGPQLQAICLGDECPTSPNATCAAYPAVSEPAVANASLAGGEGNSSATVATAAATSGSSSATGSAPGGSGTTTAGGPIATGMATRVAAGAAGLVGLLGVVALL